MSRRLRLTLNPQELDFKAISRLMAIVGMRERKPSQMRRAVAASSDVVVAYFGDELVGFGRMISDQTYYGTIWDVAVTPEMQGRRIGSRIIAKLLQRARSRKLTMVGLFTASHNRDFYERLGFTHFDDIHAMTTCLEAGKDHGID
jgi:ribosomal protein S18 acetylase RimI-like enzyme